MEEFIISFLKLLYKDIQSGSPKAKRFLQTTYFEDMVSSIGNNKGIVDRFERTLSQTHIYITKRS